MYFGLYYLNEYKQLICVNSNICRKEYAILIEEKNECTNNCAKDDKYKFQLMKRCVEEDPNITFKDCESDTFETSFIDAIKYQSIVKDYLDKNKDIINYSVRYKTNNQTITIFRNATCLIKLFSLDYTEIIHYNNPNYTKVIIDNYYEGRTTPINDVEFYYSNTTEKIQLFRLFPSITHNGTPLDNWICLSIDEDNKKVDKNKILGISKICNSHSNKEGVDSTSSIKMNEALDYMYDMCEDNCYFNKYDDINHIVYCNCYLKVLPNIDFGKKRNKNNDDVSRDINNNNIIYIFDLKQFLNSFVITNIANIKLMKCYKVLFSKIGLKNNIASYIIISLFLLEICLMIIFYKIEYKKIKNITDEIISKRKNIFNPPPRVRKNKILISLNSMNKNNTTYILKSKGSNNLDNLNENENSFKSNKDINTKIIQNNILEKNNFTGNEINNLEYKEALKLDKRTYSEGQIILLYFHFIFRVIITRNL